ncbi:MAG TPA: MoxR family ATPase [Longimicrobiales bacterium]|nr:MoxR family ATPase [Longimicrobiales bacterium]
MALREEVRRIQELLERQAYVADPEVATAVHLAIALRKPLLVEGPAGVGKTEIAKVLAQALDTELIRLQCYEGLDAAAALYEWNYPKQMLRIKMEEHSARSVEEKEASIFGEAFLLRRPLLRAITHPDKPPVLLVDEVDRADEEFEAFLLEVLSDFQVTIPEIGTIRATHHPCVILTSNRTRELSDALRRRCLFLWIDYPSYEKELRVVRSKVDGIGDALAAEVTAFLQSLRRLELAKVPGVSETLDWARALVALHAAHLDPAVVRETLGCLLKEEADLRKVAAALDGGGLEALVGAPA